MGRTDRLSGLLVNYEIRHDGKINDNGTICERSIRVSLVDAVYTHRTASSASRTMSSGAGSGTSLASSTSTII